MHITILSASTRLNRQSHRVALALVRTINSDGIHTAEILDLAAYRFPVLDEVLHRHPDPPAGLVDFGRRVRASDAHIFVSPEYNGSYTAALKNAVDALKEGEFSKKAIGTVAVSAGALGGLRAALAMQQLILAISGFPLPQMLTVGQVGQKFEENGDLIDPSFEKNIRAFLQHFLWLAEAVHGRRSTVDGGRSTVHGANA